jgi:hypothetical protein
MIVSHPGECAQSADNNGNVGDCASNEDRVVIEGMVPEVVDDLENEPPNPRQRTTAVNAS